MFCSPEIIIISGPAEAREIPPSEGVADGRRAGGDVIQPGKVVW